MDPAAEKILPVTHDVSEEEPLLKSKAQSKSETTPFSAPIILIYISVFGSRYALLGIETILPLYLRNILGYSENASTIIFQVFDGSAPMLAIVMAIFGDSLLGRFRATAYFSMVLIVGNTLLALAAMSLMSIPAEIALTMLGLLIFVIGYSAMTPVLPSFGGDQFDLPRQQLEVARFFAIFYFSVNVAYTLANSVTPLLRNSVHCLGRNTCYSLGFGVPVAVMLIALVGFASGKRLFRIKPVSRHSALATTFKCIAYAIGNRNIENPKHWLDKASDKYSQAFVSDVKALLHLSSLFIPFVFFYSLWNQVGSTWTFQATRMSGYLAPGVYIQPDQVQVTNSLLILPLIPLFNYVIYPLLSMIGLLKKPLQRMGCASFIMALSFVCAGVLELQLQKSYPVLPSTHATSFNVINGLPCSINFNIEPIFVENNPISNSSVSSYSSTILPYENSWFHDVYAVDYNITATIKNCTADKQMLNITNIEYLSQPTQVHTFLVTWKNENSTDGQIVSSQTNEDLLKSNEGDAKLRIMAGNLPVNITTAEVQLVSPSENRTFLLSPGDAETLATEIDPAVYFVALLIHGFNRTARLNLDYINLEQGGSYLLAIFPTENGVLKMENFVLTPPNWIHMLWQMPQYILLTVAELLMVIPGYQFAYEQAPRSMKSLLQSVFLLPIGLGDLVIVIITAFNVFPNQAYTFFFYVLLMLFGTAWFIVIAHRYEPRIITEEPPTAPNTPVIRRRRKSVTETLAWPVTK